MQQQLYTIGCARQSQHTLLAMLQRHHINCVVDVRKDTAETDAMPDSDALKRFLNDNHIYYLPFGKEFWEPDTKHVALHKKEIFEAATQTECFQRGVARLRNGMEKGFTIALLGAAAHPADCHRFTLVSRYFFLQGMRILHIMPSGNVRSHAELEKSLPANQRADFLKTSSTRARAEHNDLGAWGENLAAAYLQEHGFTIVERNWRYSHREIDIIALNPTTQVLSFVEVKTRRSAQFGNPELAVDRKKMWLLVVAANHYVRSRSLNNPIQFDVISITGTPDAGHTLRYIPDAIPLSVRTIRRR